MKKLGRLQVRIPILLDESLERFCEKHLMTKSQIVYLSLTEHLKGHGYKELEKEVNLEHERIRIKEQNFQLYLVKNTFVTIIRMAKMDLLLHQKVNFDKVKLSLKNCKKTYNLFPAKTKKLLKEDLKMLEFLKHERHIMQYITDWEMVREYLGMKQGVKAIELK